VVTHRGIQIMNDVKGELRPSTVRWLSLRLIEAAAIYETEYGGDGSIPQNGASTVLVGMKIADGTNVSPVGGELPAEPEKKWVCPCGQSSANKGAMVVHTRSCGRGDPILVTGGQGDGG
jgi:hypothetical protein